MTIRVLLADDQALLRATFRILIDSSEDMDVVAEAADGRDAVELTRTHRPDIVLMDIRMPGTDGLAATAEICADPALRGTRVLILTTFETDEHVARALRIGASGFLGKDVTAEELLDGTRSLITRFLDSPDPRASPVPPEDLAALTAREREVTALVADGKSDKEIAAELFLSPLTVRTHVQRAKTKLGARDRAQLVAHAYRSGLARPPR